MSNVYYNTHGWKRYSFWIGPDEHVIIYKYEVWQRGRRWRARVTFEDPSFRPREKYPMEEFGGKTERKVRDKICRLIKDLREQEQTYLASHKEGLHKQRTVYGR